jgi:hypothetical protein
MKLDTVPHSELLEFPVWITVRLFPDEHHPTLSNYIKLYPTERYIQLNGSQKDQI